MQPVVTVGQVFKNYKAMCGFLGLPIMSGNSKKSQLKHLSQFFSLEKNGQELIVKDVIRPIYCKSDFQKDSDILDSYIEALLLQLFISAEKPEVFVSKTELWQKLGMVNKDYFKVEYEELNKEYQKTHNYYFKEWIFNNFKSRVNQINNNKLEQTLNHLQNRKLLTWNKVYIEIKNDSNAHYVVDNPSKEQFIMSCERKAIDEVVGKVVTITTKNGKSIMRQSNLSDIYMRGLYDEYNKVLKNNLIQKNISGIYRKYRIRLNEKQFLEQARDIDYAILRRKINERIINLVDKGICSVAGKYSDSKTDIKEVQKWLTDRLIFLGWHFEHFFDNTIEENDCNVAELEKCIPWKQIA